VDTPIFQKQYRQQGTTEKQALAAAERRANAPTPWRLLCDFYLEQDDADFEFLLLTAQRRTAMDVSEVAEALGLDQWEVLALLRAAEIRLKRSRGFAARFTEFLDKFDGGEREQAVTVQDGYAMTYEEIGLELGCAWQRVQQIEQEALAKLRSNPKALKLLMEAR
jgi:DNA-directed RNA polymerase specialized sigma24 family protein